jgi:hypothetical protein
MQIDRRFLKMERNNVVSRKITVFGKAGMQNKSFKRIMVLLLAGIMVFCPAAAVLAAAADTAADESADTSANDFADVVNDATDEAADEIVVTGIMPVDSAADGAAPFGINEANAAFSHYTGEITMIDIWNGFDFIRIINPEGGETDFIVDGKTVFSSLDGLVDFSAVKIGETIDVYFVKPLVMTLQYPPRFTASVIVLPTQDNPGSAFVGIVGKDGLASDGSIKLTISDETEIIRQSDGKPFDADGIAGRVIIAYYAITTRSIPPIAPVIKAIVLDELGVPVFVNGLRLQNIEAFVKSDGTVMAPLRAITEALGHTVSWDPEQFSARVGVAIVVTIGSDEYAVGRAVPTKLEAAAELINDRTYAPLSFYLTILHMELDDGAGLISLSGE